MGKQRSKQTTSLFKIKIIATFLLEQRYLRLPAWLYPVPAHGFELPCRSGSRRQRGESGREGEPRMAAAQDRTVSEGWPTTTVAAHSCHSDEKNQKGNESETFRTLLSGCSEGSSSTSSVM